MRCALVLAGCLLPAVARGAPPVFIDFTEEHTVEKVTLSPKAIRSIAQQLAKEEGELGAGPPHLDRERCKGEADERGVLSVSNIAVRGDLLGDGLGPQLIVTASLATCEEFTRPIDYRGAVAVIRGGKLVASARLHGVPEIEALVQPRGSEQTYLVLTFGWMNRGETGDGAGVWAFAGRKLVEVRPVGPVRFDRCSVNEDGVQGAAVFFVEDVDPLKLSEKTYERRCGAGPKVPWEFVSDGELEP